MKKSIRTACDWARANTFKSILLSAWFSSLATCWAFRPDWAVALAILFGVLLVYLFKEVTMFEREGVRMSKGFLVLITSLALCVPSHAQETIWDITDPEPPVAEASVTPECGAGGVAAVVVVVVGTYCIYKLIKFCQRKFPKNNPPPPPPDEDDLTANADDEDTHAAALNFDSIGSCLPCQEAAAAAAESAADTAQLTGTGIDPHTTFILNLRVHVDEDDDVWFEPSMDFQRGAEEFVTFSEFSKMTEKEYGVRPTGHYGESYYAVNGNPVTWEESRIVWNEDWRMVKVDDGSYSVIIERSFDMVNWEQVLRTEVPDGTVVQMSDSTFLGQAFYRYRGFRSD
jgi:hypothetical protein